MGIKIENKGGTFEQAKVNAEAWLKSIHEEGFIDVEMTFKEQYGEDFFFLFIFEFTHSVTKKVATLVTHGFTEEQCQELRLYQRAYWNGSSNGHPKIEDWLADEFKFKIVYYKK